VARAAAGLGRSRTAASTPVPACRSWTACRSLAAERNAARTKAKALSLARRRPLLKGPSLAVVTQAVPGALPRPLPRSQTLGSSQRRPRRRRASLPCPRMRFTEARSAGEAVPIRQREGPLRLSAVVARSLVQCLVAAPRQDGQAAGRSPSVLASAAAAASAPLLPDDDGGDGAKGKGDEAKGPATRPLYPHLDLDWRPQLSAAQNAQVALVGFGTVACSCAAARSRPDKVQPPALLGLCIVALSSFCALLTRLVLMERLWQAHLRPPELVADQNSLFKKILGVNVHYKKVQSPRPLRVGPGRRVAMCLSHGFGANTYSYEYAFLDPLRRQVNGTFLAFDTTGFGLTERPQQLSKYTFEFIGKLMIELLDTECVESPERKPNTKAKAPLRILVGHSMGAQCAVRAALASKDIDGLVLFAPAIVSFSISPASTRRVRRANRQALGATAKGVIGGAAKGLQAVFQTILVVAVRVVFAVFRPVLTNVLRLAVRRRSFWEATLKASAGGDGGVSDSLIDGYRRPGLVKNWDTGLVNFVKARFALEPLWPATKRVWTTAFSRPQDRDGDGSVRGTAADLRALDMPILIIHGKEDRLVPYQSSVRLAAELPNATLRLYSQCGHCAQEEYPTESVGDIASWLDASFS